MDLSHISDFVRNNDRPIVQDLNGNTPCVTTHILASKLLFNSLGLGGGVMANEKDRFGETMKLVERAKEDIYFAERDRELIEKLKQQLKKVVKESSQIRCPKCPGDLESYTFQGFALDRCQSCGGIWMDKGELEAIVRTVTRDPLSYWVDKLIAKELSGAKR